MPTYVINSSTFALSEYQDNEWDNVNSICSVNDTIYCITDSNLYKNTGTDDNGTDISSHITTGFVDFNTNELKRFPTGSVRISYDSDNEGLLTIYNSTDGVDDTDYYDVTINATYPEYFRPQLWDGMKARYWKFKLENTNGADFTIEDWYVNPYPLGRTIK